jgi:hypothetical protein
MLVTGFYVYVYSICKCYQFYNERFRDFLYKILARYSCPAEPVRICTSYF